MFSMAGSASVLSREIWQQAKGGFKGWTSGSGPNWSGIAGSLFNVGFDALAPVLGGPRVGTFNFGVGQLINSAYNPSSGWAIPGSGRSPTVGAFEYAYGAVANGLALIGYYWIRDQLERPSAPVRARAVPEDPVGKKAYLTALARQFEGSQKIVPSQTSTQTLVDLDKYEVGAHGGVISFTDASGITTKAEVIRVSGEAPTVIDGEASTQASVPEEASPLERFWMGVAMVQAKEIAEAERWTEEAKPAPPTTSGSEDSRLAPRFGAPLTGPFDVRKVPSDTVSFAKDWGLRGNLGTARGAPPANIAEHVLNVHGGARSPYTSTSENYPGGRNCQGRIRGRNQMYRTADCSSSATSPRLVQASAITTTRLSPAK
jgi:hypothetical protein